eukprot:EG_transcript_44041
MGWDWGDENFPHRFIAELPLCQAATAGGTLLGSYLEMFGIMFLLRWFMSWGNTDIVNGYRGCWAVGFKMEDECTQKQYQRKASRAGLAASGLQQRREGSHGPLRRR